MRSGLSDRFSYNQEMSGPSTTTVTEADVWGHVVAPGEVTLSAEAARSILNLEFDQSAVDRLHELAEKNREDSLTDAERIEMETYMRVGNFLSLIKSKARKSLQDDPTPS